MKNTLLLIPLIVTTIFSCATPKLCSSYTYYYSQKLGKNDYCHGSNVDRKRKKLFKKYLENANEPDSFLIMIERISKNANLNGYSIYFIKDLEKTYTITYYHSIKDNETAIKRKKFYNDTLSRLENEDFMIRYIWENGINFKVDNLKDNEDYMFDTNFGKTIITEFNKNLNVKNSKIFDAVIYLDNLKLKPNFNY